MSNAGLSWSPFPHRPELGGPPVRTIFPGPAKYSAVVAGPNAARLRDSYVAVRFRVIHFRAFHRVSLGEINVQTVRLQRGAFCHQAHIAMVTSAPALIEILQKVGVNRHRARLSGRMRGSPLLTDHRGGLQEAGHHLRA